jgi:hypothetical protein
MYKLRLFAGRLPDLIRDAPKKYKHVLMRIINLAIDFRVLRVERSLVRTQHMAPQYIFP